MENMYKIYLQYHDNTIKEIRRFTSPIVRLNYEKFCEKIRELFPEVIHKNYVIYWKDNEGDQIVILSDNEFAVADQVMKYEGISKFYIKITSPSQEPSGSKIEKVVHPGICCDNCNGDVVGYRYKCIQCDDYDLCAQCEAKSLHSQHYMIRMPQPLQYYKTQGLVYCLKRFLKKNDIHLDKKHDSNEHSRRKKKCHEFPFIAPHDITPWLNNLMPYLTPFLETRDEPCSANDAGPSKKPPKQKDGKNSETFVYQGDNDDLDIVVGVNSDKSKNSNHNNKKKQEDNENESTSKDTGNKYSEEVRKLLDDAKDDKASVSDSASIISHDSITKATAVDEWTIVDKNESPDISRASSVLSNFNESIEKKFPSAPTLETNSSQKKIYPQLPEESKIYHSDPVIQAAVETMISMGFSNQGGLLTYLLGAEKGDINKVLDLLQSTNK